MDARKSDSALSQQTVMTTVHTDSSRMVVRCQTMHASAAQSDILQRLSAFRVLHESPLIAESNGAFLVTLSFGAVVFWTPDDSAYVRLCSTLNDLLAHPAAASSADEELCVETGKEDDRVNFRGISLKELSVEHIKVISETLGQSVVLRRCEQTVHAAMADTESVVSSLRQHGAIRRSARELLKLSGFTLEIRQNMLTRLALIDDPPEAWRSERLSLLHAQLYDNFDLRNRVSGLQMKLEYLSDLDETLMGVLHHRESHRLEWIVILLIVVEVVFSCVEFAEKFFSSNAHPG